MTLEHLTYHRGRKSECSDYKREPAGFGPARRDLRSVTVGVPYHHLGSIRNGVTIFGPREVARRSFLLLLSMPGKLLPPIL
jgi:hypothetical protein